MIQTALGNVQQFLYTNYFVHQATRKPLTVSLCFYSYTCYKVYGLLIVFLLCFFPCIVKNVFLLVLIYCYVMSSNYVPSHPLVKLKTSIPSMSSSYDNVTMNIDVDFVPKTKKQRNYLNFTYLLNQL